MVSTLLSFGTMLEDTRRYFANFDGLTNTCRTIALWISLALVIAFAITKIYPLILGKVSKNYNEDQIKAALPIINGIWIVIALTFATALIVTFLTCYFVEVAAGEESLVPILFYPLLVIVIAVIASAITLAIKPSKLTKIVCASVCGAALTAVIICMVCYYTTGEAGEAFSNVGLYVSACVITAAIVVLAFFSDRNGQPFNSRSIAFAAVCVALSFALSYVRIFRLPMGGSITFVSMLPLMLYSFMFGAKKGILAGFILGTLQALQDPWIIHPAQFALDYAVAYSAIGLVGCIRGFGLFEGKMRVQITLGAVIGGAFRFLCHYFAGVFAFGSYGAGFAEEYEIPLLANAYFYSFVYQCMYIIPEILLVTVVAVLLLSSSNFKSQINKYSTVKSL